jgi:hypothetical protein
LVGCTLLRANFFDWPTLSVAELFLVSQLLFPASLELLLFDSVRTRLLNNPGSMPDTGHPFADADIGARPRPGL